MMVVYTKKENPYMFPAHGCKTAAVKLFTLVLHQLTKMPLHLHNTDSSEKSLISEVTLFFAIEHFTSELMYSYFAIVT
jgi:hypothetical protein